LPNRDTRYNFNQPKRKASFFFFFFTYKFFKDWICYGLLDDIIDTFVPLIRAIEFEVDSIDELVLILKESEQSDMLRRIGYCRKKMMSLLRLLVAKSDVIKTLIKRGDDVSLTKNNKRPTVTRDVIIYMGDIQGKLVI
jgi:magnesium transporter